MYEEVIIRLEPGGRPTAGDVPISPSEVNRALNNIDEADIIRLFREGMPVHATLPSDCITSQRSNIEFLLKIFDEAIFEEKLEGRCDTETLTEIEVIQGRLALNGVYTTVRADGTEYYIYAVVDTSIATDLPELLGNEHSSPARYRLFRWWVGRLSEIEEI